MSEPLSPAKVAEIRARAEAATPGPWGSKCNRKYCRDGYHAGHAVRNDRNYRKCEPMHEDGSIGQQIAEISGGGGSHKYDADFISHARTDVPALCDSYDAQARRIAQFEALVMEWENREAAVCPEDYGFEEVIKQQAAEIKRLKADASTLSDEFARLKAKLADALKHLESLDGNDHVESCQESRDMCASCGWEFDDHPVKLEDRRCEEFQLRDCTCGLKVAITALAEDAAMQPEQAKEQG